MIRQIKGRWRGRWREREGENGKEDAERRKEKSRTEVHGLEKPQVLRGLIDVEDGSVAVDLPILSAQHIIILIELCFHCRGIFGLEIYRNNSPSNKPYLCFFSFFWSLLSGWHQ